MSQNNRKKMNDFAIIAIVGFGSLGALFASLLAPNMPFEKPAYRRRYWPCQPLPTARFIGEWRAINTQLCHGKRHHSNARRLGDRLYQVLSTQWRIALLKVNLATIRWLFLLNGIASEKVLANAFGDERIVYCGAANGRHEKNEPHEKMGKMVANWFIATMDNWSLARWQLIALNARACNKSMPSLIKSISRIQWAMTCRVNWGKIDAKYRRQSNRGIVSRYLWYRATSGWSARDVQSRHALKWWQWHTLKA